MKVTVTVEGEGKVFTKSVDISEGDRLMAARVSMILRTLLLSVARILAKHYQIYSNEAPEGREY